MARKDKAARPAWTVPVFWLPSLVLLLLPCYEAARALSVRHYAHYLFCVHDSTLKALSACCLITALVAALLPPFRQLLERHLDGLSRAPRGVHLAWLSAAYIGLLAWFCFLRFCQYRSFQLPQDTAVSLNEAYN